MKLRVLYILTILFSLAVSSSTMARKPAVEDFVGVETEDYRPTTKGTEVMFNFGNHIDSYEKRKRNSEHEQKTNSKGDPSNGFVSVVLVAFIILPFAMWFAITSSAKNNMDDSEVDSEDQMSANPINNMNNIKSLSDYRDDDGASSHSSKPDEDDVKKVS